MKISMFYLCWGGGGVNGWRSQSCKMTQLPFFIRLIIKIKMICILYGFLCEMDFSHHESPNPARVAAA